ncbi:MAG: transporter substrate-binding domain-containing protein [Desulfobacterales bacterium]|nr:transporter substrate-binding domain-containing protein [Desulfobacterales bacterium]MCP4162063.1 transporter substrate-binding domain-containing protein [Deltaproteobacteria bacterium]
MFKKFSLITMIMFFVLITKSNAEETWKITSLDWQPYSGAKMTNQGNSIQKLREILKKNGIRLLVEFYPWKRAQYLAKKKGYIGYFPAWPEEVTEGFIASSPADWSELKVIKRSEDKVTFKSFDDLFKNYKVGFVKTYVYPKVINDAIKKYPHNINKSPNEIALLKKLSYGRYPAAITDPNVMLYLAEQQGITNIEPLNQIVIKKELVIALRFDNENAKRIKLLKKFLKNIAN